ncbi:MAG: VWA domain-containing protein [Eggerthellaceae bacterium]|nr:VWA domain-containing protein [Eggerthellaceae bacterium]
MRKMLSFLVSLALTACLVPGVAYAESPAADAMAVEAGAVGGDDSAAAAAEPAVVGVVGLGAANDSVEAASADTVGGEDESASDQAQAQIVYEGGSAEAATEGGGRVTVSKFAEPTGIENYFDIVLRVDVEEPIEDSSTAVVLVMDVSNTMNQPVLPVAANADADEAANLTRLQSAQNAANSFIQKYCEGEGLSPDRQLGMVVFNTNAQWATGLHMQTVTDTSASALQAGVNAITAPSLPSDVRFTNMEAGLQLAYNALAQTDAAHKYVIFLTDGFPTTYIDRGIEGNAESDTMISGYDPYEQGAYSASKVGQDGYFADAVLQLPCTYGTSYSDKAAERAAQVAAAMKSGAAANAEDVAGTEPGADASGATNASDAASAAGINIFSVGIDIGGQTISQYVSAATGTFSVVDRVDAEYEIGSADNPDAYAEWLGSVIAGGPALTGDSPTYADGDSAEELNAAFDAILEDIRAATGLMLTKALTLDPMGEDVDFQHFYDVNGQPAKELSGSYEQSSEDTLVEDTAEFSEEDNGLTWDLLQSGYTVSVGEDGTRGFHFDLRYCVRLANESEGFSFDSAVPANDGAVLEYQLAASDGGSSPQSVLAYPDPQVEGYAGTLVIRKVSAASPDQPVEGALFELKHSESCATCAAAAAKALDEAPALVSIPAFYGTSDADGMVRFENVPSGHDYVLVEASPAEGYYPTDESYLATVGYGAVSVKNDEGDPMDGEGMAGGVLTVENEPVPAPPAPDNPVTPTGGGDVPAAGELLGSTGDAAGNVMQLVMGVLALAMSSLAAFAVTHAARARVVR